MEKKLGPVSAFGYLLVFVAGLAAIIYGGRNVLLLVAGTETTAKVTDVQTHQRNGRRTHSVETNINYTYAVNGVQYNGQGPWSGSMPAMVGDKAPIRYLSFAPGWSAPKDALIGPGFLFIAIGAGLIWVDYAFYKKRTRVEEKPAAGEKKPQQGKKRARRSAA
jgi:hypothetical protein